ncbi:AI-2E family transporter [Levilactobacillus brevis]|uniref:AI-2E family transporter n=1 Tax=Levilactobacillus brevis TaxID=1580 RepID=UPI001C1ECD96|nr:AI-2E family transporter [Levilactobacillus brevis]MBU7539734.1 AI-2E family transporter [Levilactobacillus brevis]MBU7559276.1 AI-2E family transporter [Levilactobacillus brevis]MBU7566443.1 AI-2E family transporter [Levilactobacillus brevis]MCE6010845.1 AI-2E family transporter [Levilactobacillus brevis]MCE6013115.1 AI-2E family transporter [Levilactobacillus brevis]
MVSALKRFWQSPLTAYYFALILLIILAWNARAFLSLALFTIIFIYLGNAATMGLEHRLHVHHLIATLLVYLIFLGILVAAFAQIIPPLVTEVSRLPHTLKELVTTYPQLETTLTRWIKNLTQNASVINNGKTLFTSGIVKLSRFSSGVETVILAFFFSFIFNLTKTQLRHFVHAFTKSRFSRLFVPMGELILKFVTIFGTVIETQLMICSINTVLMVIGLWLIGMPSLLILGIMVFFLGLIPVAGVLISLIPLTIIAFISGGILRLAAVLVLVILIHLFESYFLHPRLMANATNLPIFVTFITLIVSERLFGAWGLIVGVPLVAFFLEVFDVQLKPHRPTTIESNHH